MLLGAQLERQQQTLDWRLCVLLPLPQEGPDRDGGVRGKGGELVILIAEEGALYWKCGQLPLIEGADIQMLN
jgi:hypothetical protein